MAVKKVIQVSTSVGMGKPGLAEVINDAIRHHAGGWACVDVCFISEHIAFLLFDAVEDKD